MPSFAYRISGFNRRRKWEIFLRDFAPQPADRVLDVGFSDNEYSATDNFLEKHYPYRAQITALGIDAPSLFPARYPDVKVVQYEGREFPLADNAFDVAWSNAVIEHVGQHEGRREAQILFLREIARVSTSAFVTTPNKWFPIEVHTRTPLLHWLPKRW
ncbi:MAG: class I SAM-dependent methyltransferase, partial [Dehalococcoidia bacterium]